MRGYSLGSQACIVVIGTGLLGWLLNIVLVLCSGPLCVARLPLSYHRPMTLLSGLTFPAPLGLRSSKQVTVFVCCPCLIDISIDYDLAHGKGGRAIPLGMCGKP